MPLEYFRIHGPKRKTAVDLGFDPDKITSRKLTMVTKAYAKAQGSEYVDPSLMGRAGIKKR